MSAASSALRYHLARSFVNRTRVQLRRVKSPRYAIAFLVGALYLWTIVARGTLGSATDAARTSPVANSVAPMIYEVVLLLTTFMTWIFGDAEPALNFSGAEVLMLFTAPVSRPTLIRYKLVQTQIAILFSVFVWRLLLPHTSQIPGVLKAIALWVLFTTLYLHRVGASFVRVSAAQHGRSGLRRNAIPLTIAAAAIGAVAWTVYRAFPALVDALRDGSIGTALFALRQAPAIRVVLWPFHALVAPVFAATIGGWSASIGWGVLLLAGSYLWVMHAGVAFEEAAMQRAERLAAQRAARQARGVRPVRAWRPWVRLAPTGRPWVAIAWKNTVAFQRLVPAARVLLIIVFVAGMLALSMPGAEIGWRMVQAVSLSGAALLTFFGPLYVRTDLQQDMLMLPLIRSYPLSGAAIVGAEIAGTVALLFTMQIVLLLAGFPVILEWAGSLRIVPVVLAALLGLPAVTALRVAVANAWPVLLPGWVHLGPGRSTGIESLGQNLLTLAGSLVVHILLLVLPAAAAVAVGFPFARWAHAWTWALVPAAIAGTAVAALELWVLVRLLGGVLGRTDPAAVEAAIA